MSTYIPKSLKNLFVEIIVSKGLSLTLFDLEVYSTMSSPFGTMDCATWFCKSNGQIHFSFNKFRSGLGQDRGWVVNCWPSGESTDNFMGEAPRDDQMFEWFSFWLGEAKAELDAPDLLEEFRLGRYPGGMTFGTTFGQNDKALLKKSLKNAKNQLLNAAPAEKRPSIETAFDYLETAVDRSQNAQDIWNIVKGVLFPIVLTLGQPQLQHGFNTLLETIFRPLLTH